MRYVWRALVAIPAVLFGFGVYLYLTLPDVRPLRDQNPGSTAFMELRAREARGRGVTPRHEQRWVELRRISPNLRRAVVEAEDGAFWQHDGIDLRQIRESFQINLERGEFARGASTITQQLAKNLYLSPDKTVVRKARELMIARRLEAELSKARILEIYLNVIEWGDGVYGAEAAARRYFGKPAAQLGVAEAALLAGAVINPRVLNPASPTRRLVQRQQIVMRLMGAPRQPAAASPAALDGDAAAEPAALPVGTPIAPVQVPATLPGQVLPVPKPPGGGGTPAHLDRAGGDSL
jgi:monofunctional glycosyltransferase